MAVKIEKSPILAAILSFVFGGAGQIYIGQTLKGIVLTVIFYSLAIIAFCLAIVPAFIPGFAWLGVFLVLIPGGVAIVEIVITTMDAYKLAQQINQGEQPGNWDWFFKRAQN